MSFLRSQRQTTIFPFNFFSKSFQDFLIYEIYLIQEDSGRDDQSPINPLPHLFSALTLANSYLLSLLLLSVFMSSLVVTLATLPWRVAPSPVNLVPGPTQTFSAIEGLRLKTTQSRFLVEEASAPFFFVLFSLSILVGFWSLSASLRTFRASCLLLIVSVTRFLRFYDLICTVCPLQSKLNFTSRSLLVYQSINFCYISFNFSTALAFSLLVIYYWTFLSSVTQPSSGQPSSRFSL